LAADGDAKSVGWKTERGTAGGYDMLPWVKVVFDP
jgi:hypothetical protein